jgi:hypothetical protein
MLDSQQDFISEIKFHSSIAAEGKFNIIVVCIFDTRALVSLSLEMHDKKSSEKLLLLSGDAAWQYLQRYWSKDQSTTVLVKGPSCNNSPPVRIEYVSLNETIGE